MADDYISVEDRKRFRQEELERTNRRFEKPTLRERAEDIRNRARMVYSKHIKPAQNVASKFTRSIGERRVEHGIQKRITKYGRRVELRNYNRNRARSSARVRVSNRIYNSYRPRPQRRRGGEGIFHLYDDEPDLIGFRL